MKTVFTTGEAAEICKVSQQTIIRCFDSGRLKGFRVPGSRFRRIPRDALLQFMKDNDIPPDTLPRDKVVGEKQTVFVNSSASVAVRGMLGNCLEIEVNEVSEPSEFWLSVALTRPDVLIIEHFVGDDTELLVRLIDILFKHSTPRIIILGNVLQSDFGARPNIIVLSAQVESQQLIDLVRGRPQMEREAAEAV